MVAFICDKTVSSRGETDVSTRDLIEVNGISGYISNVTVAVFPRKMFSITFTFAKKGLMKYISHLDLMRLLTRALRRAQLPIKLTQGFNPHPKLSMVRALKLGLESDHEEARVALRAFVNPQDFCRRFAEQLPEGITIKEAYYGKRDFR